MITINIPGVETYDSATNKVYKSPAMAIDMEYSLFAISKWEEKYHKPFLSKTDHTREEMMYMYQCMTYTPNVPKDAYYAIRGKIERELLEYMADPHTAATFKNVPSSSRGRNRVQTAETFYYNMAECGIDVSREHWHINKLIALLTYCNLEGMPKKKRNAEEVALENAMLNFNRRK